jgi:hypothetical protein
MDLPGPPRFDGASLLNLAATVDAAYGNATPYALLADDRIRERLLGAARFVVWLIDGLGVEPLQKLAPDSALAGSMAGELTSVFPSSTAPALTALATARSPAVHAAPEWFIWFDELGGIYRSLPLDARAPHADLPAVDDAGRLYPATALSQRANRPAYTVMPAHLAQSTYSRYAHAGARILPAIDDETFVAQVLRALDADPGPCSVYAYEPRFDETAHRFGVASERTAAVVRRLDGLFARLADELARRDALLVVTADHGFIDVPAERRLQLEDFPRVRETLARPLCGGPRAPICYVAEPHRDRFADVVSREFAGLFVAVPSAELVADGWFGPGNPDARLASRLGTHMLLPRADVYLVDRVDGEEHARHVGMHGGSSPAEMRVPLITN